MQQSKRKYKEKMYIFSANCKPLLLSSAEYQYKNYPYQMIEKGSRNKQIREYEKQCLFDERYKIASIHTNLNNMDFMFNYAAYVAFVSNNAGLDWIPKHNKLLLRYLEFGYMPIIHLPTFAISAWTPVLLGMLDALQVPYLKVPAVPIVGSSHLSAYDYVAHRADIAEALERSTDRYINARKAYISKTPDGADVESARSQIIEREAEINNGKFKPENLRLDFVLRRLYKA